MDALITTLQMRIGDLQLEIEDLERKLDQRGWTDQGRKLINWDIEYRKGQITAYRRVVDMLSELQ